MDEIQLITEQLATERQHAAVVAHACATALQLPESQGPAFDEFRQRCVDYLVCVLARFEERDQRLTDLVRGRFTPVDAARRALEHALESAGRSRETLERLAAAVAASTAPGGGSRASWSEFARYFSEAWSRRREAVDALLAPQLRVSDWRGIGGVDADSILEERRLYARVAERLPPGVRLSAAPGTS